MCPHFPPSHVFELCIYLFNKTAAERRKQRLQQQFEKLDLSLNFSQKVRWILPKFSKAIGKSKKSHFFSRWITWACNATFFLSLSELSSVMVYSFAYKFDSWRNSISKYTMGWRLSHRRFTIHFLRLLPKDWLAQKSWSATAGLNKIDRFFQFLRRITKETKALKLARGPDIIARVSIIYCLFSLFDSSFGGAECYPPRIRFTLQKYW